MKSCSIQRGRAGCGGFTGSTVFCDWRGCGHQARMGRVGPPCRLLLAHSAGVNWRGSGISIRMNRCETVDRMFRQLSVESAGDRSSSAGVSCREEGEAGDQPKQAQARKPDRQDPVLACPGVAVRTDRRRGIGFIRHAKSSVMAGCRIDGCGGRRVRRNPPHNKRNGWGEARRPEVRMSACPRRER